MVWYHQVETHSQAHGIFTMHYFALDPTIKDARGFTVNDDPKVCHLQTTLNTLIERWSKLIHQGLSQKSTFEPLSSKKCE